MFDAFEGPIPGDYGDYRDYDYGYDDDYDYRYAAGCHRGCTCARPRALTDADRLAAAQQTATILSRALTGAYERGWQPGDIVHVTCRRLDLPHRGAVVALVLAHAHRFDAFSRAPRRWAEDLRALALAHPDADAAARRFTALIEPSVHSPSCDCPRCCTCRSRCEDSCSCDCGDACMWCAKCAAGGHDPFSIPEDEPDPFEVLFHPYFVGVYRPLGDRPSQLPQAGEDRWRALSGRSGHKVSLHTVLLVWNGLPQWPHLCPPPSQWDVAAGGPGAPWGGSGAEGPDRSGSGQDGSGQDGSGQDGSDRSAAAPAAPAKVLVRIRGLLAKAESTGFPDEAEALAAKAQELMTRHAVDAALLHGSAGTADTAVHARRIHLHNPYLREKVRLLSEIGRANATRTVWSKPLAIATVVGPAEQIDHVELLYTSLLIQVTRAMKDRTPRLERRRISTFRSSFLTGFAMRVGERLAAARDRAASEAAEDAHVSSASLVPVLRARDKAVREETDRLFPRTRATRGGSIDPHGWLAGKDAADEATITAGGGRVSGADALPAGRAAG